MEAVVADTSALVSLAIPSADNAYDTGSNPDLLQFLLTSCSVSIPVQVKRELQDIAQYDDIDAAAATNVLAAAEHYAVEDPFSAGRSIPEWGLDAGETAAVVLANQRGVDGILTDEFAGTSFPLIHARIADATLVTTPRLVRDYVYAGHLSASDAKRVLDVIGDHRSWEHSSYVQHVRELL